MKISKSSEYVPGEFRMININKALAIICVLVIVVLVLVFSWAAIRTKYMPVEITTVPAVFEHASKSCAGIVKTITVKPFVPADYRVDAGKRYPYTAECSNGLTISATITVQK